MLPTRVQSTKRATRALSQALHRCTSYRFTIDTHKRQFNHGQLEFSRIFLRLGWQTSKFCAWLPSSRSGQPVQSAFVQWTKLSSTAHSGSFDSSMAAGAKESEVAVLDREAFTESVQVKALRMPKHCCNKYMKLLRSIVFNRPRQRAVVIDTEDSDKRLILLREDVGELESVDLLETMLASLKEDGIEVTTHEVTLDYNSLSSDVVLKRILPEGWEIPSSFETVGHIAHINLRDEYLPYKHAIGQVILDKNPSIKTVVNKVGNIENEYRVLPLEVVAGKDTLEATIVQHKARFMLNYSEVYWNSRLEAEHRRLVEQFKAGEVIADVMAGIGPFAIPAAQLGNQVYANDLNPRSYHYLRENIKLNKVSEHVKAFQMDGREFIRRMGGAEAQPPSSSLSGSGDIDSADNRQNGAAALFSIPADGVRFHRAIMNLPASAVEFLDAFQGAFQKDKWQDAPLPLVHVYTFARSTETDADVRRRVEQHLGGEVDNSDFSVRLVRDVAPNKRMVCITFRVPENIAYTRARRPGADVEKESPSKKQRLESD